MAAARKPRARASTYERIYGVVKRIPRGRVATYGQVARLAGLGPRARQVGYALHRLEDGSRIPWQRVVNHLGQVSERAVAGMERVQRALLEAEGVPFDERGRIDLARAQWRPRSVSARAGKES